MIRFSARALAALLALSLAIFAAPAGALPGFYVSKKSDKLAAHTTHLIVVRKGDVSVVTIAADYEGPLSPFAWVLPVPGDVTLERVKTLKMEYVDRVEKLTAPRFHEFWETDPCDPEKVAAQAEK